MTNDWCQHSPKIEFIRNIDNCKKALRGLASQRFFNLKFGLTFSQTSRLCVLITKVSTDLSRFRRKKREGSKEGDNSKNRLVGFLEDESLQLVV